MLDRERLAKILAMTTSTHDGEALNAIRKANEMIKGEKLTWDEVLVQVTGTVINIKTTRYPTNEQYTPTEDWVPPHLRDPNIIEMLFRTVYAKITPGTEFAGVVDSWHQWWKDKGMLTPKQYMALRSAYNRASR